MCISFKTFAHAKSIYDIDINFFKDLNIKYLLIDLDNTLDSYKLFHPTDRATKLIENIKNSGIEPIIISNNKGNRVSTYANDLKVRYLNSAYKPLPFRINKFLNENSIKKTDTLLIGDQMMTDVLCANNTKLRIILTDKIVKEDQWTTRVNRILGNLIRKIKTPKMKDWREVWQSLKH